MWFGILQRYILGQVLRFFVLALVAITTIFVLFVVMAEASRSGLTPRDIVAILPFVVPTSLPYTVPVALLFSVSVFYGRMAGDNEVIAVKTAGLGVTTVLWPSVIIGAALSGLLYWATADPIPRAASRFKQVLFSDAEDMFYKILKKTGEFNVPNSPFHIGVAGVEGKTLIRPWFMHRAGKGHPNLYDAQIQARRARLRVDTKRKVVTIELENSQTSGGGAKPFVYIVNGKDVIEYPIPENDKRLPPRIQEMTVPEIEAKQASLRDQIAHERQRQAVGAAMKLAAGQFEKVDWERVGEAYQDYQYWGKKVAELETEKFLRRSLSIGSLSFVLLGAPVGILFARRDYLSAFISCFMPIIVIYYPLTLAMVNLSKEGRGPAAVVFGGNGVLLILAALFILRVRRH